MARGQALGPICVSTMPRGNQPRLDSASSFVEKWGDGRHGALVIRLRRRCVVFAVRGTRPVTFDRIARPRATWRRWRHRNDPPRGVSMSNGEAH